MNTKNVLEKDELDNEIYALKVEQAFNDGYDYNDELFEGVEYYDD